MYLLAINQNDSFDIFDEPDTENLVVDYDLLKGALNEIGVDHFEVVPFRFKENDYILCVDEEGRFKENLLFNPEATLLSGREIIGNALILSNHHDEEMYALTKEQLESFIM